MHVNRILCLFAGLFLMAGCGSVTFSDRIPDIQPGMTSAEVTKLMGKPDYRRFNGDDEQWEYHRLNAVSGETKIVIVDFIRGIVERMDLFEKPEPPRHDRKGPPAVAICPPETDRNEATVAQ